MRRAPLGVPLAAGQTRRSQSQWARVGVVCAPHSARRGPAVKRLSLRFLALVLTSALPLSKTRRETAPATGPWRRLAAKLAPWRWVADGQEHGRRSHCQRDCRGRASGAQREHIRNIFAGRRHRPPERWPGSDVSHLAQARTSRIATEGGGARPADARDDRPQARSRDALEARARRGAVHS